MKTLDTLKSADTNPLISYVLITLAAAGVVGFLATASNVLFDAAFVRADEAISAALQRFRTATLDHIMVAITMLGDALLLAPLAVLVVVILLVYRRWRLALLVAFSFLSATLFVPFIKSLLQRSRPMALYEGAESFSFPSGHATLSATILGITLVLIAQRHRTLGRSLWSVFGALLIGAIGFSRVYLRAHWPSDVLAGLLFGATLIFVFAWLVRDRHAASVSAPIGIGCAVFFAIGYPLHLYWNYPTMLERYATQTTRVRIDQPTWVETTWRDIPLFRISLEGEFEDPMMLQTPLALSTIGEVMRAQGWTDRSDRPREQRFDALLPARHAIEDLPPLPLTHEGQAPVAVFTRLAHSPIEFQLSVWFWPTGYEIGTRPLWVASVQGQAADTLLGHWSVPEHISVHAGTVYESAAGVARALAAHEGTEPVNRQGLFLIVPGAGE